jgi:hypothetical protein
VKTLCLVAALAIAVTAAFGDDDPTPSPAPTRELSLAERAAAARKLAEAQGRSRDSKNGGRVLNNEDLKKAKGNVIYLQPAATNAPANTSSAAHPSGPSASEPVVNVVKVPAGASGDVIRELDESRGRAIRLRATIDETQRALADAPPGDARTSLEERLRSTLNELLQTQEAIGVLSERMRQSDTDPASGPKK